MINLRDTLSPEITSTESQDQENILGSASSNLNPDGRLSALKESIKGLLLPVSDIIQVKGAHVEGMTGKIPWKLDIGDVAPKSTEADHSLKEVATQFKQKLAAEQTRRRREKGSVQTGYQASESPVRGQGQRGRGVSEFNRR